MARGRDDCRVEAVFGRSATAIGRSLRGADLALVDASEDHAQAIDLFSEAVARLGPRRVSIYSERMHDGLELFVRTQGAWLLLGPLASEPWEDYCSTCSPPRPRAGAAATGPAAGGLKSRTFLSDAGGSGRQLRGKRVPMKSILSELQELADSDLFALCEAVDMELQRRESLTADVPDSARRRAIERGESYRRRTGAVRRPFSRVGLRKSQSGRRAAERRQQAYTITIFCPPQEHREPTYWRTTNNAR